MQRSADRESDDPTVAGVSARCEVQELPRASERMFMTPSGLSILMRELENQLGFRLFDRNTRQVVLTEHGNALLPVVQQSMDSIQTTIAAIARTAGEKNQRLSVG